MAAGVGSMTFDGDLAADGLVDGQIDDLFGDDDDIFNAPAPLPPLSPSNLDAGPNSVGGAEGERDGDKKKKKVIKRSPQPRLDDLRLCSDRGIPALAHLCDGIKFKGKGQEASDLKVLIQSFEHWAHRLYPKYPFNDFVEQIEAIGGKKLVQNAIKSVRRGDDGEVHDISDEELLLGEQESSENASSSAANMNDANFGGQIEASRTPVTQLGLTPEQQERIRLNKERALARRTASNNSSQLQDNTAATNSQEPSTQDSGNTSPERHTLDFDSDLDTGDLVDVAKETSVETMETGVTQNDTMKTNDRGDDVEHVSKQHGGETEEVGETMETGMTQNETMETGKIQNETMETGKIQNETMETGKMQNETMETGKMQNETMETGKMQNETMETGMTQNETMETGMTQNETMETNVMLEETIETEKPQNETMTTKPSEAEISGNPKCLKNKNLEMKLMETMDQRQEQ